MRNSTQVETREIADSDLDRISGGVGVSGAAGVGSVGVFGGVDVEGLEGLVATATSALSGVQVSGNASF